MDYLFYELGVIIIISGTLAWLSLIAKQPILVAYLLGGVLLGPYGLSLIKDVSLIDQISNLGIVLLLFLAGVVLHPERLKKLFKTTIFITLLSSLTFFGVAFALTLLMGYSLKESLIVGLAMMFSSTIMVIKLLPTDTLHHQKMGSYCIAILIAQDMIAVLLLMFLSGLKDISGLHLLLLPLKIVGLFLFAMYFEEYILRKIMRRVDRYHEILYLVALAWCMIMSMLSHFLGFNAELGAFLGGVALARTPISYFISQGLKFFQDFFLVLFFFVIGAKLDIFNLGSIILPALLLAGVLIALKPVVFIKLFRIKGEEAGFSKETGFRLGQASEFSMIIAVFASRLNYLSDDVFKLIQVATIITMIISSYIVVYNYYTPISPRQELKQD